VGTVTKIWYGLGACVALSNGAQAEQNATLVAAAQAQPAALAGAPGEGGEGAAVAGPDNFPGGFDKALEKVLAGEGGEGGRGLSKMLPSVTSPALAGAQVKKALTGNTLYSSGASSLHYDASGRLSGWVGTWAQISPDKCPAAGETYFQGAKGCYQLTKHSATGTWKVENDQLCRSFSANGKATEGCSYVALLLDTFALFDGETGTMSGKGFKLLAGKQTR
jgi:hypothetical protein